MPRELQYWDGKFQYSESMSHQAVSTCKKGLYWMRCSIKLYCLLYFTNNPQLQFGKGAWVKIQWFIRSQQAFEVGF